MKDSQTDEQPLRDALLATAQGFPVDDIELYSTVKKRTRERRRHRQLVMSMAVGLVVLGITTAVIAIMAGSRSGDSARLAPPGMGTLTACQESLAEWPPAPLRPEVHSFFVPPGAKSVSICRYEAPPGTPLERQSDSTLMKLSRGGELSSSTLSNLVSALNAAPAGHMRCPRNPTVVILARFHYEQGLDVEVRMGAAGCSNATNGALSAITTGIIIPGFIDRYEN